MNEAERLRREIRAAREELVRKRSQCADEPTEPESSLPLMPNRDEEFLRLALMSIEELKTHIERLERDLTDLNQGIDGLNE